MSADEESEQFTLLELIQVLLDGGHIKSFDRHEAKDVSKFLHQTALKNEQRNLPHLTQAGPCLGCARPIEYRLCSNHKLYGEAWYRKTFSECPTPYRAGSCQELDQGSMGVRNFKIVRGYVCDGCISYLENWLVEYFAAKNAHENEVRRQNQEARGEGERILLERLLSPTYGSFYKGLFRDVARLSDDNEARLCRALKDLPYADFLKSFYWRMVKWEVRKAASGRCILCSSIENLHVHHKTYEHHGAEHYHLEDLALLCSSCHSKFHDKYATEPQEAA